MVVKITKAAEYWFINILIIGSLPFLVDAMQVIKIVFHRLLTLCVGIIYLIIVHTSAFNWQLFRTVGPYIEVKTLDYNLGSLIAFLDMALGRQVGLFFFFLFLFPSQKVISPLLTVRENRLRGDIFTLTKVFLHLLLLGPLLFCLM